MARHLITREIGIDAGHRVPDHGSKCRNLHGHRYTIQATCSGPLAEQGVETGMVLDFGFLKDEMMKLIDDPCDHALILWCGDPILEWVLPDEYYLTRLNDHADHPQEITGDPMAGGGHYNGAGKEGAAKVYITPFVPTAENLARHWFELLWPRVGAITHGRAELVKVKVWETPNCSAEYPADG